MKNSTKQIVSGALIAALYAGLTYLMAFFGLAYGPVQIRVSEVLTLLPIFMPSSIYGLTVGCFLANIMSFNVLDMIFGTFATLIAAVVTYKLRNIKTFGLPMLSMLSPVFFNAVIVGLEIAFFWSEGGAFLPNFLLSALWVGLGELIVCVGMGIPFYLALRKNKMILSLSSKS